VRTSKIPGSLLGFAVSVILSVGGVAIAEPPDEWELKLNSEILFMDVMGADLHALTTKTDFDEVDDKEDSVQRARDLDLDWDVGWRGDLAFTKNKWGAGVSGFYFGSEGKLRGSASGDNSGDIDELALQTPSIGLECTDDEDTDECFMKSKMKLDAWMIDMYGIRELLDSPNVGIDLQFGLRLAELGWDTDGWAIQIDTTGVDPPAPLLRWEEASWYKSESTPDDLMAGPFLSLASEGRWGRFRVEGQLSQAVVVGDWRQESRIWQPSCNACPLEELELGEVARAKKVDTRAIPVTDLRIKLGYDILEQLTLGVGGYVSAWFGVPTPPNAEVNANFAGKSTFYDSNENLVFVGGSVSLEYRFHGP
jgi:hypothetical protein